jgi:hypothetical protein
VEGGMRNPIWWVITSSLAVALVVIFYLVYIGDTGQYNYKLEQFTLKDDGIVGYMFENRTGRIIVYNVDKDKGVYLTIDAPNNKLYKRRTTLIEQ